MCNLPSGRIVPIGRHARYPKRRPHPDPVPSSLLPGPALPASGAQDSPVSCESKVKCHSARPAGPPCICAFRSTPPASAPCQAPLPEGPVASREKKGHAAQAIRASNIRHVFSRRSKRFAQLYPGPLRSPCFPGARPRAVAGLRGRVLRTPVPSRLALSGASACADGSRARH